MCETAYSADAEINETLEAYSDLVYKLALSRTKSGPDAEDIFQEVFMRYISCKKVFESEEHKKAWLIKVTINCSNKLFGSAWMRHRASLDDTSDYTPPPEASDESGIFAAMSKLPASYRTVIHLFYYEDMSIRQISLALKKKEGTVKSQLNRARALLKNELKGEIEYV